VHLHDGDKVAETPKIVIVIKYRNSKNYEKNVERKFQKKNVYSEIEIQRKLHGIYYVINFSFYRIITIFTVCLKPNSEHCIHIVHE